MILKPGDVVTDEPTEVGTVVTYARITATNFVRTKDGAWCDCGAGLDCPNGVTWYCVQRYLPKDFEIRLVSTSDPAPAPAGDAAAELNAMAEECARWSNEESGVDMSGRLAWGNAATLLRRRAAHLRAAAPAPAEWDPVDAVDVRVGDEIEVTRQWDGGRMTFAGVVTNRFGETVYFGPQHSYSLTGSADLWTSITIRRRVRKPMEEPGPGAVVEVAGRRYAHADRMSSLRWRQITGENDGSGVAYLSWVDVLKVGEPTVILSAADLGGAS